MKIFRSHYFHALLILTALTVLFTYPIAFHMRSSFYGYPGDAFGVIWYLWSFKHSILDLGSSPLFTTLVGSPGGTYMPNFSPVVPMLSLPLTYFFDEVFAYNFLILSSFVLSGLGMYLLAYHLLRDRHASLVSGVIFAFAPYHIAHSMDHLGLAQTQWIPFTVLYMLKLDAERNWKNALLFSVFLTLAIFTDAHYALFTVLLISFYVLYRVYSLGSSRCANLIRGIDARNLKLAGIIAFVVGTTSVLVYRYFVAPAMVPETVIPKRDIYELIVYSAKPWDLFLPPVYHPVFGKYVKEFVLSHLYGSNPIEQVLYVGYAPLALATYALFRFGRDRRSEEHRTVVLFALFGLFAFSFMPPAYLPISGWKIPFSLSYLLYQFTQSFRVMARFDVLVMLSVAVLAGAGAKHLMQQHRRWVALSVIMLIVLFEYAPIPSNIAEIKRPEQHFPFDQHSYSFHTTKIEIPSVYSWLAEQEGDFVVVEYPLVTAPSKEEIVHYRYQFYQRIHKKRLINGAPMGVTDAIRDLSDPATTDRLRELGVRYLIVHENLGVAGDVTPGLKLVKSFEDARVYEVPRRTDGEESGGLR